MKYSAAIAMALAPMALAKSARRSRPDAKRSDHLVHEVEPVEYEPTHEPVYEPEPVVQEPEVIVHVDQELPVVGCVLLWTNMGGGVENNPVHEYQTVTKTVTVAHDAMPTEVPVEHSTVTVQPGATEVIAGPGATHEVTVGGPQGLSFFPQEVAAEIGDTIIFTFLAQNHSVTQSTFGSPCDRLDGGMDSGFMSNPDSTIEPAPQVAMQVMTDEPLWMYCAQGNHCGQGMVFSINPSLEKTHAQFQEAAIAQKGSNPAPAITGGETEEVEEVEEVEEAPAAAPVSYGNVAWGVGTVNADGSCHCAVQCDLGTASGLQANQGAGGMGGIAGAIDMQDLSEGLEVTADEAN